MVLDLQAEDDGTRPGMRAGLPFEGAVGQSHPVSIESGGCFPVLGVAPGWAFGRAFLS